MEGRRRSSANKSIASVFAEIYERKWWGNPSDGPFYSGRGSSPSFGAPYSQWVNSFIAENKIQSVVDLGCGDFQIGRLLQTSQQVSYIGIDIVPSLIEHNKSRFGSASIDFRCLNIIDDQLPDADLCLIRQVLQHLSNDEISRVIAKCNKYRYLCITDEIPSSPVAVPNVDKPHGPDTRLFDNSGLFLELQPFSLSAKTVLEIEETPVTTLRTLLVNNRNSAIL